SELHDVLGVRTQMVLRQDGVEQHAQERAAEDAREDDRGDRERTHGYLLAVAMPANPVANVAPPWPPGSDPVGRRPRARHPTTSPFFQSTSVDAEAGDLRPEPARSLLRRIPGP